MTTEVVLALLLCVPITLCQVRQSCTYYEVLETEGNQNDWWGDETVDSKQRCKEFCSRISMCAAAEYSHSNGSCYLYEGPTTLRYNKDHVFMLKRCTEIRQNCTYYEVLETEGNQNDWRGFKTVDSKQRCQEFCSEISVCAAAEYSHSNGSCYLYEGPTTLRYNKDHVFMLKRCTEITTVQGTTKVEEITTSALTSLKADVNPTVTTETTTATTVTPTTTVITSKSSSASSTSPTTTSTTVTRPKTVSSSSPSTTTTSTTTTATLTPLTTTTTSPVTTSLKTSSALDDIKTMMNYALTSDETRTKKAASTERISKMVTTEKMRTRRRKKKRRLLPFLKMDMQHKRNKLSTPEYTPPTTMQARTATTFKTRKQRKLYPWTSTPKYKRPVMHFQTTYPDTSLTKSPTIEFTTPLPRLKPSRPKQRQIVQASKAVELKITDPNEGFRADISTTAQTNVRVPVRTSSYKPPTYGRTRPRDVNRVATPIRGHPGTSSIGRPCDGNCHYQQFMHSVFIPMVRHVPVMRPHMQPHQPYANLNPPVRTRFRGRVRSRPYWTSRGHHYPMQTPYWYNSRSNVPYRPGAYPPQHAPVAHYWQPQYRHNRRPYVHQRYSAYPPQQYGRQSNPWENNFKRESLRGPKPHHLVVIPGKRFKSAVPRRRIYRVVVY